jgi:SET domain-containing protein
MHFEFWYVVEQAVANAREAEYSKRGVQLYFFRLNESTIVDATMKGSMARYVNHSCGPK